VESGDAVGLRTGVGFPHEEFDPARPGTTGVNAALVTSVAPTPGRGVWADMRLYYLSTKEAMARILRDGFSERVMGSAAGVLLTRSSPVMAGEPVLTVYLPDEVVQSRGQEVRYGEFVFSPDVLNWVAVVTAGR
jgi:hypothetical protein